MVTTSGNLAAGTTINGQGGDGNGRITLKAKLALGVALLGCAGTLAFGGLRATSEAPSQAATGAGAAGSAHQVWTGTCRAGGSDCLPGDDDTAPGVARTLPQVWTGTCRAGGSDCLPDEDLSFATANGVPQPAPLASDRNTTSDLGTEYDPYIVNGSLPRSIPVATSGAHAIWAGTCRAGGSDCLPGDADTAPGVARTLPQAWTGTCRAGSSDCLPDEDFILGVAPAAPTGDTTVSDRVGPREFLEGEEMAAATAKQLPTLWNIAI